MCHWCLKQTIRNFNKRSSACKSGVCKLLNRTSFRRFITVVRVADLKYANVTGNTHATLPNSSLGTSLSPLLDSESFALNAATRAAISSLGNLRSHTNDTLIIKKKINKKRKKKSNSEHFFRWQYFTLYYNKERIRNLNYADRKLRGCCGAERAFPYRRVKCNEKSQNKNRMRGAVPVHLNVPMHDTPRCRNRWITLRKTIKAGDKEPRRAVYLHRLGPRAWISHEMGLLA